VYRSLPPLTKTAFLVLLVTGAMLANAQEPKKAPLAITPAARLAAAKTALVRNGGGSSIPFNVIVSSLEGWGRFTLVDAPEKADIILEVSAPDEGGGVSVSSSTKKGTSMGRTDPSTTTNRQISVTHVRMIAYDAKSKVALWSGTEQPKFAMKQRVKEDSLVEAAQRLVSKFRERVEPPSQ
jgi:hypothetical protein